MTEIILKLLDNWHWLIILLFSHSMIKLIVQSWLKIVEIRTLNKNIVVFKDSPTERTIEIRSHDISVEKVQRLRESLNSTSKAS